MYAITLRAYFLVTVSACVLASVSIHAIGLFRNTLGCDFRDLLANEYVSYCSNRGYSDYEHGALYYGLEPLAIEAMRTADVLFLGNSRVQMGWDSEILKRRFSQLGIRYYVLGFGYVEQMRFALALIEHQELRPKALVINADPFFEDVVTEASRPILEKSFAEVEPGFIYRRALYRLKSTICGPASSLKNTLACSGGRGTIYRNRLDGIWRPPSWPKSDPIINPPPTSLTWSTTIATFVTNAARFRAQVDVKRECMILTVIPAHEWSTSPAIDIARSLGFPVVIPDLPGLSTSDGSHLTADSAKLWSDAFLDAASSRIRDCVTPDGKS
jgi:hypothetical protein